MQIGLRLLAFGLIVACWGTSVLGQQQEEAAEDKWNVAELPGPVRTISFETSEGTWVNVDVSPDGRQIVFDLLGDLYVMPVAGTGTGLATRVTSGAAFDMQPRFSPDGKWIAFASDRDGLTNIWIAHPDGTGLRQVSREKQWFVNSPAWAPDGQYVFARRHLVKQRSLGAGEIWMFHVGGGSGVQVTDKNGWQKDAGEPSVSPDGRYLYYSKDVTPGQTFEYNKNPYGVVYAIIRRALDDGTERTLVSRPGGSATPRVSPDGRWLSYVRRVDLKTVLFVRNLDTGEERPIFDRLDRDMQETWAVHGVYTQYAWTPDGAGIVIWGEGKIWHVDIAAARGREIPFRARVEQEAAERLVFPQEVHPPRFQVRMLRNVATAPDGSSVAYGALGHIYVRPLPDGEPRRLTDAASFEFDPSWSPDGRSIVFTTWSDEAAGRVRMAAIADGAARDVVSTPGHYIEPSFSPDGTWVVYKAAPGDDVRGRTFAERPGLYLARADGTGEPRLLRDEGSQPQFDHTGTRVYFRDRRDDKFVLASVDLQGEDEQVHLQSENATQIVPSPDGRWVAFAERYHAYVAAFPRAGRTVDIGPKTSAFPVARISRDAGLYLHWSGDSATVHWALGPELYTRPLARTFSFLEGGSDEASEPEAAGRAIGFEAESDEPSGTIALVGAKVIALSGDAADQVIDDAAVVVIGNRIAAVGPMDRVRIPADAKRIDVDGTTIVPGWIDAHAHVRGEGEGILAEQSWPLVANLAYGITTAHDPSNNTETVFANSELVRAGMKLSPRLFSTGTILYGAETPYKAVVASYEDAQAHLRRLKAVGAFSVKSYNQQRRDARQMIIKAAREQEMMVVPEGGSLLYMDETLVHDGHTGLEHSLPVRRLYKDVIELFAQAKSAYTPTIIVGYGGLSGEYYFYQEDDVWKNERLTTFVPAEDVLARARRRPMAAEDDFNHIDIARGAKGLLDAGVLVQLGAHGQLQGLGAHWEVWSFVQGGMTPLEALRCATVNPARYLGLDGDLGSIAPGKLADLVVLDRDPLADIRNTDSVRYVMKNGRLYDAATMNEIGNHPETRAPFPWQPDGLATPSSRAGRDR